MAPDIILEYVYVRDVAAAHVAAMTARTAGGHRQMGIRKHSNPVNGAALIGGKLIPARDVGIATAQSLVKRGLA